jgi:hypothetical protein
MIRLKGCPKCSGDMHYDPLVEEYVCLQCGLAVDSLPSQQTEPMRPSLAALAPSLARLPASTAEGGPALGAGQAGLPAGQAGRTSRQATRHTRKSR